MNGAKLVWNNSESFYFSGRQWKDMHHECRDLSDSCRLIKYFHIFVTKDILQIVLSVTNIYVKQFLHKATAKPKCPEPYVAGNQVILYKAKICKTYFWKVADQEIPY